MHRRLWHWAQSHPFFVITVFLFIFLLPLGLYHQSHIRTSNFWNYFIAAFTGSWSNPQSKSDISDTAYIFGVWSALVLNLGAYIVIFGAFWNLIREIRRKAVTTAKEVVDSFANTAQLVLLREFAPPGSFENEKLDEETKQQFENTAHKIERCVEYSRAISMSSLVKLDGRKELDTLFGKEQVDRWLQIAAERPLHNSQPNGQKPTM